MRKEWVNLKKRPNYTFVNFAVSGLTLTFQLPVPLLPLSFTPNSITGTVILSATDSPSLNYPASSKFRTLLLVLSYHSHPALSSLAQNHWTHRIQAPVTYLQSSHNYSTSIPSWPHLYWTSSYYSLFIRRYSCRDVLSCSFLLLFSVWGLATPWTYFLHLSVFSVILIDSSTGSPVHVLMSIQAELGLRAPGIVPCITSFSRQLPCFLMVWP